MAQLKLVKQDFDNKTVTIDVVDLGIAQSYYLIRQADLRDLFIQMNENPKSLLKLVED